MKKSIFVKALYYNALLPFFFKKKIQKKKLSTLSTPLLPPHNILYNIVVVYSGEKIMNKKIPIWFMRQAGRYMPEYREIKKNNTFLSICYNKDLINEITLQPIRRFDFDSAIIFSDILVILDIIGFEVNFVENFGIKINHNFENFFDLKSNNVNFDKLNVIYQAISMVRTNLNPCKNLIGFCGSPWTLICYALEKRSSKDFMYTKTFLNDHTEQFECLFELIIQLIVIHLKNQIKAGCDIIQIFDSWSGILDEIDYQKYVVEPTIFICQQIKLEYPNVKIAWFPRNSIGQYLLYTKNYQQQSRFQKIFELIDILSIDHITSLDVIIKNIDERIILQGNLDPVMLLCKDKEKIKNKVLFILDKLEKRKHIFNLGHGVIKTTPLENVDFVIDLVRNF